MDMNTLNRYLTDIMFCVSGNGLFILKLNIIMYSEGNIDDCKILNHVIKNVIKNHVITKAC